MTGAATSLARRLAPLCVAGGLFLAPIGAVAAWPMVSGAIGLDATAHLRAELERGVAPTELYSFYRERDFRPLWIDGRGLTPAGERALAAMSRASDLGLNDEYQPDMARALRTGASPDLARAEAALSKAFGRFVVDLRRPEPGAGIVLVDAVLDPSPKSPGEVLEQVARAKDAAAAVDDLVRMSPAFEATSQALKAFRSRWSALPQEPLPAGPPLTEGARGRTVDALRRRLRIATTPPGRPFGGEDIRAVREFQRWHGLPVTGVVDEETRTALNRGAAHYERILRLNVARLRAAPANPGRRHVRVNVATQTLTTYENGKPVDTMRVVVGARDQQTPAMAGLIRYAVLNPYWNIPPDLVRTGIATDALRRGPAALEARKLEVLSDWGLEASLIDPRRVDWRAVATGERILRVRQKPGPHNMMGAVKYMLPNRLGIYLHDTPDRSAFQRTPRTLSAGCVRLEDAAGFGRWLFGTSLDALQPVGPEHRVDLPDPVPVYILYLTAEPRPGGGLLFHEDVYGRDATRPETRTG